MLEAGGLCWPIFSIYVKDSINNVFFVNHSPCVSFLKSLREFYRKSKILFVIHDQGWTAPLLGDKQRLKELVSGNSSRKINQEEQFVRKYFHQEQKMYNIVDDVVCLSETTEELLCNTYKIGNDKVHVVHNGISIKDYGNSSLDRQSIRDNLGISPDDRVFLFVGRTVKAKGIDDLFEAFENLCEHNINIRLVVAGEIFRFNDLARLAPKSSAHITYTGLIPKDELRKWYIASDIGVIASYTEQCSYTGLEMMAHGLLVISTDGNGLTDMFRDQYNAIVANIKPKLAENLEKAMQKALSLDERQRNAISHNAIECVRENYSLTQMGEGYSKILFSEPI